MTTRIVGSAIQVGFVVFAVIGMAGWIYFLTRLAMSALGI
jgi:hypothetical protein